MTVTTPQIPISIYEDEKGIMASVVRLRRHCPTVKSGDLLVPFDNKGNLLRNGYVETEKYDYNTNAYIPTGAFKVERKNELFVEAIKFVGVFDYGPRKGKVAFKHPDGRETYMSNKHFEDILPKMVRGWLIGKFRYIKFYGVYGLECVEVLV